MTEPTKKRGGAREGAGRKKISDTTVQFRCTVEKKSKWADEAKKNNQSLSDWIISRLG